VLAGVKSAEHKAGKVGSRESRVGLVSASVFDHPGSLLICRALAEQERLFSISSTRVDTLNHQIVAALRAGGQETLTLAPEAGSERLRLIINKPVSDETILGAASAAWEGGFRSLKLYFMVGLPAEERRDLEAIGRLVSTIAGMFEWRRLVVSASCFVPKPWTPFQWAQMECEKGLAGRLRLVRGSLRQLKAVSMSGESAREAIRQGILSRGDRRLRDVLLSVHRDGVSWRAAFEKAGVSPDFYLRRPRHRREVFPWDHIESGVAKSYLWAEYQFGMTASPSAACVVGDCRRCGVCDT